MITKNYKTILALLLESAGNSSSTYGRLPIKSRDGISMYAGFSSLPTPTLTYNTSTSASSGGIRLGSGNTPPTENDYTLETLIESGISAQSPSVARNVDSDGNPYISMTYTLSNSTSSDKVIKEIGFFQTFYCSNTLGGSANLNKEIMLDRTVLENPLIVPAKGTAVLKYTLKTIINTPSVS